MTTPQHDAVLSPRATDGALILMPKWGAAATLPLSIVLGWLLTYGFERPMSRAIRRCVRSDPAPRRGSVVGI